MSADGDITYFPHAGVHLVELRGGGLVAFGRSGGIWTDLSDFDHLAPAEPEPVAPGAHQMGSLSVPSLGTQFGPRVVGTATVLSQTDLTPVPTTPEPALRPAQPACEDLTAKDAAAYLGWAWGTFRNKAKKEGIRKLRTGRYSIKELDRWKQFSKKST